MGRENSKRHNYVSVTAVEETCGMTWYINHRSATHDSGEAISECVRDKAHALKMMRNFIWSHLDLTTKDANNQSKCMMALADRHGWSLLDYEGRNQYPRPMGFGGLVIE